MQLDTKIPARAVPGGVLVGTMVGMMLERFWKSEPKCMKRLERVKGIEPSYSAWEAAALPLS
ncbi:hypothetical protein ABTP42_19550, partial [Acinetobacter baumannii]